jgi:uncharacterized protein YndB with AHSA1/START domain
MVSQLKNDTMSNDLQFDFSVDKTTNSVSINREFAAGLLLVWDAFTKPEILDRWWAPKPFISRTKYMDFRVGGRRFYAMVSPEGQENWSIQQYTSISPTTNFNFLSSFADKDENINEAIATSNWDLNFSERNGTTLVSIRIQLKTLADLELRIQMGFKEGFTVTLNELETLLATSK